MVGLYATVIGLAVIVLLVLVGLWLTWLSLREEQHRPKALQQPDAEDADGT